MILADTKYERRRLEGTDDERSIVVPELQAITSDTHEVQPSCTMNLHEERLIVDPQKDVCFQSWLLKIQSTKENRDYQK